MNRFIDLHVNVNLVNALTKQNIIEPTDVQKQVVPSIISGNHVIFQSETGTGKTFAYLLPLISNLMENPNHLIIIISPTHELASQIKKTSEVLCKDGETSLRTALLIGGTSFSRQIDTLKEKPHILIGGPSRIMELISLKKIKPNNTMSIVLDEVDRLLSPELRDATINLLHCMPENVQLVACSATIHTQQIQLLKNALSSIDSGKKQLQSILLPQSDVLKTKITHIALYAEKRDKIDTLRRFLAAENPQRALVFSSTTTMIPDIINQLHNKKIKCLALHAKTDKVKRKKAIDDFRSGKCPLLVTSDLAARGLDIQGISHIIQMDLPRDPDFFIHRAGRTARAGKFGINIVIGDEWELRYLSTLEKKLGIIIYPKVLYDGKMLSPEECD